MKRNKLFMLLFTFNLLSFGCKEKSTPEISEVKEETITVYDFHDKEQRAEYGTLKLDDHHPNLLNPQFSKSDNQNVLEIWTELHQNIVNYLEEQNFDWGTNESQIKILHKFYFEPNGNIKVYFFRIFNDEVSTETRKQFADHIANFAKQEAIDYQMTVPFAQCGKTSYPN